MDRKRDTAPEIDGYVATKIEIWRHLKGSSQTWQYHHDSDWRPDGRMVRVSQSLESGETHIWKGEEDAGCPLVLSDPTDAEIEEAVRRHAHGHIRDMSSDIESLPDRTAARKLVEGGLRYGDYLGGGAWCKHEGRIMHAILALDEDGKQVVDYDNHPVTYPQPDRPAAVVVSWNVHDALPLVGHETVAPNLDAAIELVRKGLVPIPDIAEHGIDEAEIDRMDDDDSNEGILASEEFWDNAEYRKVVFDYNELVASTSPSP